jgi:hypothetical protein
MVGVPQFEKTWTTAGLPSLSGGAGNCDKSGLHAAKMKFGTQNAGKISVRTHNYMNKITYLFCYTSCALKI